MFTTTQSELLAVALSAPLALALPNFDMTAFLVVAAIAFAAAVVAIAVAIAMPAVAIAAGATLLGTVVTVVAVAALIALVAGTAAGIYWGEKKQKERVIIKTREAMEQARKLHITFLPDPQNPELAKQFTCQVVSYLPQQLNTPQAHAVPQTTTIEARNAEEFYQQLKAQVDTWLDDKRFGPIKKREVWFYTKPSPGPENGEAIASKIKSWLPSGVTFVRTDKTPPMAKSGHVASN